MYWTLLELKFCALTHDPKFRWPYWGLSVELWTCTWRIDLVNWQGGEVHWQQLPEVLPCWKMFCIWVWFCSLISHSSCWRENSKSFSSVQFSFFLENSTLLTTLLWQRDHSSLSHLPRISHFFALFYQQTSTFTQKCTLCSFQVWHNHVEQKQKVRIRRVIITDCNLQKLCFRLPTHDKNEQNDHNAEKCKQHFNNMIASYGILVSQRDTDIRGIKFVNCGLLQNKVKLEYCISVCPCHYPKLGTEPDYMDTRL